MATARLPIDAAHRAAASDAHGIGAVTGLDAELAGKAPLSHTTALTGVHGIVRSATTSVGLGESALAANDSGGNVAVGHEALKATAGRIGVTAVGYRAGYANTTGYITAVGNSAGYANTSGVITAVGYEAGRYLANGTTGNETAGGGTYIGQNTRASVASAANETVIGYTAIGGGSNTMRFGNASVTNWLPGATNVCALGNATTAFKELYLHDGTDEWKVTINTSGALVFAKQA